MESKRGKITRAGLLAQISTNGRRFASGLRMAPMIDMIFLLLIFFLVAGKWRPMEQFLPMVSAAGQVLDYDVGRAEPLVIYIDESADGCSIRIGRAGEIAVRRESLAKDLAGMIDKLRLIMEQQKRFVSDPVEIVCQEQVSWDYVAKIYNLLYGAGLKDITFRITE